ncbi:MAG: cupin domain-containing protein [bacterium]|nr:cupin domain-containing protein [bacterium]
MIDKPWSPHIVAEFNGLHVKLAKAHGEFLWHTHEETDEVFLVHRGSVEIQMRNRPSAHLSAGDLFVVPAGLEHRPVADAECEILLIEPAETPNTGDAATATAEVWI